MATAVFFLAGFLLSAVLLCALLLHDWNRRGWKREGSCWECLFWSFSACLLECVLISFLAALIGCYSIGLLLLIVWLQALLALIPVIRRREGILEAAREKGFSFHRSILLLLLLSSLLYFLFPVYYLWGRRDPVMYLIKGVGIAKTGSMRPETDAYLNEHYEEVKGFTQLTYRGVYSDYEKGDSSLPGDITYQFLDFFPSLLAIGYSLGGLPALFRMNGAVGILCILAVYYYAKDAFGQRTAVAAAIFTALNPAQLWGAKIIQTELLFQLCWILGVSLFSLAWKHKSIRLAALSGLLLGITGLNRIDGYILGVAVLMLSCYVFLFVRDRSRLALGLAGCYFITSALSLLYTYYDSYYYFIDIWNSGTFPKILYLTAALSIVCAAAYWLGACKGEALARNNPFYAVCESKKGRLITCWLLFWAFRLVYYARPLLQKGVNRDYDFSQRSLKEFCWYTSVTACLFFILSVYYVMKDSRLRRGQLLFFAAGAMNLLVYLWQPAVADDHIWASRRWVSVCFPFLFVLAAYGMDRASHYAAGHGRSRGKRAGTLAWLGSVALVTGFLAYQCRLFAWRPMLQQMPGQYERLAGQLDSDKVYLAQMSHYGSVLRFIYGKNVYVMKEGSAGEIARYTKLSGKPVYFIGDIGVLEGRLSYRRLYEGEIMGAYLRQVKEEYPSALIETGARTDVYEVWNKD